MDVLLYTLLPDTLLPDMLLRELHSFLYLVHTDAKLMAN